MKIVLYYKKNLRELLIRIGKGVWVLLEALSQDIFPVPEPFHSQFEGLTHAGQTHPRG